jgi:hypothetical protein
MHITERTLELAELLGWPKGVTITIGFEGDEQPIISGGELWWRRWLAEGRALGPGDEDDRLHHTLEWAAFVAAKGGDPGPPATWEEQYVLSVEAEMGMEIEEDDAC